MEYSNNIEEKIIAIYEAYDSTVLEEFKKKNKEVNIKSYKKTFINYLIYKHDDKNIKYEIEEAKTDKEKQAIVKKYAGDFEEWKKRQRTLSGIIAADLLSMAGVTAGAISNPVYNVIAIMLWGSLIKVWVDDYKARDGARREKYKENKK